MEAEKLKKEQAEARFEALKNQVNPHFLFNSLNVLTTLVHKDADQAEQFIRRLSTVYRYVLDSRDKEVVTLDEELKALEAFLFLMKTRFGDAFEARIEVPDRQGRVAPLTLQMLVENALKHNEVSKSMPLSISIVQQNGHLEVRNNLQPRSNPGEGSGVGLENIRGRYRFLTDRPLDVRRDADFFTVIVPIV
jgi:LytS/YehU family sensor histidine kinase